MNKFFSRNMNIAFKFSRTIATTLLLLAVVIPSFADNNSVIKVSAPNSVVVDQQVNIAYTIENKKVSEVSDFPTVEGFDFLIGPSVMRSKEFYSYNGREQEINRLTYTYVLLPTKVGNYTIPPLTFKLDGKDVKSPSVAIKVLPKDKVDSSKEEVFVIASVSKNSVYEQQSFIFNCKIYVRQLNGISLRQQVKMPEFKDLHTKEIELEDDSQWTLENYRGQNYFTKIYKQYVMYPQRTGNIEIEPILFPFRVRVVDKNADPMEQLFYHGSVMKDVDVNARTNKLTINVKELPTKNKPLDFIGGVGEFSATTEISDTSVEENSSVTVTLTIKGKGNINLISNPAIKFPDSFDVYEPKVTTNSKINGVEEEGVRKIEYLAIPRTYGEYEIEPIKFSYFDVKTGTYKTIETKGYTLKIAKSTNSTSGNSVSNFTNKEDIKVLNNDIRFISTVNTLDFQNKENGFYNSIYYGYMYLLAVVAFLVFIFAYRAKIQANSDIVKVKNKQANKIATKRLKQAKLHLKNKERYKFYDEILKALWGYISDKLNIEVSLLSKDNIEEKLHEQGVDNEVIKEFISILDLCEFERFAPLEGATSMEQLYDKTVDVIGSIEQYKFVPKK